MVKADAEVDVSAVIGNAPVGARQIAVVALCALIALLDGLDLQSIGLAAPVIAGVLKISPQAFGAVFSAALAGLAVGAFALGPAADRIGRKKVLIGSVLGFGLFTLCTAFAGSLNELLAYRFLTGLGLGGAMPSFISLGSEYAPTRHRATFVGLVYAGFPLGGVLGGLLASWVIPSYGWQALFLVGGALPIALAAVIVVALPESIGFLVNSGASRERVAALLRQVSPTAVLPDGARFVLAEETGRSASVGLLFARGRAVGTTLLWISFFFTFMMLVTNAAWGPTLLRAEGIPLPRTALAMVAFNFGSLIGTSLGGYLLMRIGVLVLMPVVFIGATLALAATGYAGVEFVAVTWFQGALGLCLGAGSSALIAISALLYPTAVRSTGVGCAMGMGRVGSFIGPLCVGLLVGWQVPTAVVLMAIGLPALVVALTAALIFKVGKAQLGLAPSDAVSLAH